MYYDVIIKSKTSFLDNKFTYAFDQKIEVGSRVIVPFGRANVLSLAFVIAINEENQDIENIKFIEEVLDSSPILNKDQIEIIHYMVESNLSDYSSAIQSLLPPGSIDKIVEYFSLGLNADLLDKEEKEFFEKRRTFDQIELKFPKKFTKSALNKLVDDLVLYRDYDKKAKASRRYFFYISLIEDFSPKANAHAQKRLVDYLKERGEVEKDEALRITETSLQTLNNLVDKEVIRVRRKEDFRQVLENELKADQKPLLNDEQQNAYDRIIESDNSYFLIHGITGSGKTEVYLRLVEHYISLGKEAIMLVPEIALTPQTIERFQRRFGKNIAVLHSKLSISERYDQWSLIKQKKVKIVVGARSAVFAPFDNLGIIIIDEEHETSYKSDRNPKYSANDIAMLRSRLSSCKLVLGTATPSVDTMYKVYNKEIELIKLTKRATNSSLPQVDVVDMTEELKNENFSMFSAILKERMEEALKKKNQIILFLNKRGHTSYVFCRSCGYVHRCEACDVAMTYHKYNDRLICHFCGRTSIRKKTCENCGSTYIKEFGAGTEKLEEETRMLFPKASIFRMDADTITKKSDYDRVYRLMVDKKIDILIGTQMLAKGLDFPNVTLVGVMAADISLNLPDYKASEKTYQLITQVSGRAGRGEDKGYVVIQSYKPSHYAIQTSSKNDYYSFFKEELLKRRQFQYPPFQNILVVNISSKKRDVAVSYASKTISEIMKYSRRESIKLTELSGPTPSVIERINNYYRFNVIMKSKNLNDLLKLGIFIKNERQKNNEVYVNYTINPDNVY